MATSRTATHRALTDFGPFQTLLREQREIRLAQLEVLHVQASASAAAADGQSAFGEIDMEGYDADVRAEQVVSAYDALAEIDAALARIEDGTYGVCSGCSQPIPAERLEVLPHTRFCVGCQSRARRRG